MAEHLGRAGTAYVEIRGNFAQLNSELAAQGRAMNGHGSRWGKALAGAMKVGVVGAAGVVAAGAREFTQFNQQMTLVQTQAGASGKEVKALTGQVLNLAKNSEFGPTALAQGLYRVESAGFRGAKAMEVLNTAQKLAAVGQSDLESTTYALTATLKSGISGTENMATTAGTLSAAVGLGNMRMDDMVGALSTGLVPAAKGFGLTLTDVTSAIDVFTRQGVPAQAAATRLRMALAMFASAKADKAMEQIGIHSGTLLKTISQPGGLLKSVQLLSDHLKNLPRSEQMQVMQQAFGVRQSALVMTLVQHVGELGQIMQQTSGQASRFSANYRTQMDSPAARWKRAIASIRADLVQLGAKVMPGVSKALEQFANILSDPNLSRNEKLSKVTDLIASKIKAAMPKIAQAAAQAAPKIVTAFVGGFMNAGPWGRLAVAGFIMTKLKLWGPAFARLGMTSATSFAGGMSTGMGREGGSIARSGGFLSMARSFGKGLGIAAAIMFLPDFVNWVNRHLGTRTAQFKLPKTPTFFGVDLRPSADSVWNKIFGGGVSKADKQLEKFGQTAEAAFKKFNKARDSRSLAELADQARQMAVRFPKAALELNNFAGAADDAAKSAAGAIGSMQHKSAHDIGKFMQNVQDLTFSIQQKLGYDTRIGTEALASNFMTARVAILKEIDARHGRVPKALRAALAEINGQLLKALESLGLSTGQARGYLGIPDPKTGAVQGHEEGGLNANVSGKATGGFVIGSLGERGRDTERLRVRPGSMIFNYHHLMDLLGGGYAGGGLVDVLAGRGEVVAPPEARPMWEALVRDRDYASLEDYFAANQRKHYMASGGIPGVRQGAASAAQAVMQRFPGLSVTSGARPGSGTSYHASGQAVDIAGAPQTMNTASNWIKSSGLWHSLAEGIHNPNLSVKNGQMVSPGFWGATTWAQHMNHIHLAVIGALGKIMGPLSIKTPKIGGAGGVTAAAQAGLKIAAKSANRRLADIQAKIGGGDASDVSATGPAAHGPKHFAGRVSMFGPPGEAAGKTASGLSSALPGIALYNQGTLRGVFRVNVGGHSAEMEQTDIGPAPWTGRVIDVTGAGARRMGINPSNFPTDSYGTADRVRARGGFARFARGGVVRGFASGGTVKGAGLLGAALRGGMAVIISSLIDWRRHHGTALTGTLSNGLRRMVKRFGYDKTATMLRRAGWHSPYETVDRAIFGGRSHAARGGIPGFASGGIVGYASGTPRVKRSPKAHAKKPRKPPRHIAVTTPERAPHALTPIKAMQNAVKSITDKWNYLGVISAVREADYGYAEDLYNSTEEVFVVDDPGGGQHIDFAAQRIAAGEFLDLISRKTDIGNLKQTMLNLAREAETLFNKVIKQLQDLIAKQRKRAVALGKRAKELQRHISDLTHKRHMTRADHAAVKKDQGELKKVQGELQSLTGDREPSGDLAKWDSGGSIGDFVKQQGDLTDQRGTWDDALGPTNLPDEVRRTFNIEIPGLQRQLAAIDPAELAKQITATGASAADTARAELLQTLLNEANLRASVANAQFAALRGFPPFGGSFAEGGVVPGPLGAPRTAIVHGGEVISNAGDPKVRVLVEDNRTRVWVNDVERIIERKTRSDARGASRGLPSGGGGVFR